MLATATAQVHVEPQFIAYFHGGNEVPPNDSSFSGVGYFMLEGNVLSFVADLPLKQFTYFFPSGAGIYGPAGRRTNGSLIFDLPPYQIEVEAPPVRPPFNNWYSVEYVGSGTLEPEQVAYLTNGLLYVNIKSTNFPYGELRGQICPLTPECDCDGDGVANKDDLCADTLPGAAVDANGCSIEQLCPCSGPWKDHKEYIRAVREQAFRFWKEGRIRVAERNSIVRQAEQSSCGSRGR